MITPKFTPEQVMNRVKQQVARIEDAILENLKFIGERFVTDARTKDTYKDRTGNLRSSIGYAIAKNGEMVYSGLPGTTTAGKAKAAEAISKLLPKHPTGFTLYVVAGMEYAAAVESKNFNVITVQSFQAIKDIEEMVQRIKNKISKAA